MVCMSFSCYSTMHHREHPLPFARWCRNDRTTLMPVLKSSKISNFLSLLLSLSSSSSSCYCHYYCWHGYVVDIAVCFIFGCFCNTSNKPSITSWYTGLSHQTNTYNSTYMRQYTHTHSFLFKFVSRFNSFCCCFGCHILSYVSYFIFLCRTTDSF